MNRSSYALVALTIVALIGAPIAAHADDQDVIDYREHVMNSLSEQAAALGQILSGAIPDDNLVAHMDAIATVAATALKSFEPKIPGGEAKPEVWDKWPDFAKRMNEFVQKTAEMAKIAKTQGKEAAVAKAVDALTCKSCHEVYRLEKKK